MFACRERATHTFAINARPEIEKVLSHLNGTENSPPNNFSGLQFPVAATSVSVVASWSVHGGIVHAHRTCLQIYITSKYRVHPREFRPQFLPVSWQVLSSQLGTLFRLTVPLFRWRLHVSHRSCFGVTKKNNEIVESKYWKKFTFRFLFFLSRNMNNRRRTETRWSR